MPPLLGQLRGGPRDVGGIVLELGLETLQQGKGVGAAAGEAAITYPSIRRRILTASAFMIEVPIVTWPSPPIATRPGGVPSESWLRGVP